MSPDRSEADRVIRIAAAIIDDERGRVLLVRKAGTTIFMQPGGKIMPGETPLAALRRELDEELDLVVDPVEPFYLGRFTAEAANEPGHLVEAELFLIHADAAVSPNCEIEELVWVSVPDAKDLPIAPLTRFYVLPLVEERSIKSQAGTAG